MVRLKVQFDGTLYIQDSDGFRPVTQEDADRKYRDAYRQLFAFLGKYPPDGDYVLHGRLMKPVKGNPALMDYARHGGAFQHSLLVRKLSR